MGNLRAHEAATTMTEMAGLRAAIFYHLQANHFPPVPETMVPICIEAVQLGVEQVLAGTYAEEDILIDLPEDISYRGASQAPLSAIIESHHLEPFIMAELERLEEE